MTEEEKLAGKEVDGANVKAECGFAIVKQVKLRGGTNLSINKCAGDASMTSHLSSINGCHWLHLSLSSHTCPLPSLSISLLGEALMKGHVF